MKVLKSPLITTDFIFPRSNKSVSLKLNGDIHPRNTQTHETDSPSISHFRWPTLSSYDVTPIAVGTVHFNQSQTQINKLVAFDVTINISLLLSNVISYDVFRLKKSLNKNIMRCHNNK